MTLKITISYTVLTKCTEKMIFLEALGKNTPKITIARGTFKKIL